MLRMLTMMLALWTWAGAASAQENKAIEDVIGSQLEAFNERDIDTAWGHASPLIKGLFGNSQNFAMMVERGYPMVWDNRDVRFLERAEADGFQYQKVLIRDAAGVLHVLAYKMIETDQGWQIDGVDLLAPPEVGA